MSLLAGITKKKVPAKKEVKKHSRKLFVAIIAVGAVVVAGIIVTLLLVFNNSEELDQSAYSISYTIEAVPVFGCLNVEMNIDVHSLSSERDIVLYKGMTSAEIIRCTDEAGNDVPFFDDEDLIGIGPIEDDAGRLYFEYNAYIGEITDSFEVFAIPYANGCILEDLIAFSGEYAILMPYLDPEEFDSIGEYVKKISMNFIVPDGLDTIIPYQQPLDGQFELSVDKPDWEFFNIISKSAFCFGQFEKFDNGGYFGDAAVYVDKGNPNVIPQYTFDAILGLLNYYSNVFGEPLGDVPIVLLRNLDYDDTVITAAAGGGGSAISANMRIAEDVRALSNMLYHTFFDSKVKPRNLRYTGNFWIYRGLSEFYVGNSVGHLPGSVLDAFSIGNMTTMSERYLRYLYFTLKEPGFLGVSPLHETSGMYASQEEFYMGVKVPLIIDAINYSVENRTGRFDGFIKALVNMGKSSKPLDVQEFMKMLCGPDYDMIESYLTGNALMTNYRGANTDGMTLVSIMALLDEDEHKYAYFFETDKVFYPYTPLFLLNEEAFMSEVAKRGIRYNNDEIQNEVNEFSPVVHRLLLQYAMWASLAGVDDITRPNIKREITSTEVMDQWSRLCDEIGIEYGAEDYDETFFY